MARRKGGGGLAAEESRHWDGREGAFSGSVFHPCECLPSQKGAIDGAMEVIYCGFNPVLHQHTCLKAPSCVLAPS